MDNPTKKTKIFLTKEHPAMRRLLLVKTYFGQRGSDENNLFTQKLPPDFGYDTFEFVERPEEADFFLAPADVRRLDQVTEAYLKEIEAFSLKYAKKTVVFVGGDLAYEVTLPYQQLIVCYGSRYRSDMKDNEIIVPPFTEDLWYAVSQGGNRFRNKGNMPLVGFCGWAAHPSLRSYFATQLRRIKYAVLDTLFPSKYFGARVKGVIFRQKAIALLRKDRRIVTKFILRKSYSGNTKTISTDPETARLEYLQNILTTDYTLTPKGDGNYSIRFYETLSLGRVPLFIDTDSQLPFENLISYEKILCKVPYKNLSQIGDEVVRHYERMSDDEYVLTQERARNVYREYLRYDAFFNRLFGSEIFRYLK